MEKYNKYIVSIKDAFENTVCKRAAGSNDAAWTRAIKESIGELGFRSGYEVCASGVDGRFSGEWLYDLIWYKIRDGLLESVPLVLESEWAISYDKIKYDFEKLLTSNAAIKIMVFHPTRKEDCQQLIAKLRNSIKCYAHHSAPCVFLLACYRYTEEKGDHFMVTCVSNDGTDYEI